MTSLSLDFIKKGKLRLFGQGALGAVIISLGALNVNAAEELSATREAIVKVEQKKDLNKMYQDAKDKKASRSFTFKSKISQYDPEVQQALKQGLDILCLYQCYLRAQAENNEQLADEIDAKMKKRADEMKKTYDGAEIFARMCTYSFPQMDDDAKYGVKTDLQESICQVQEQRRQHFKSKYTTREQRQTGELPKNTTNIKKDLNKMYQDVLNGKLSNSFAFSYVRIGEYDSGTQQALKQGLDILCLNKCRLRAIAENKESLADEIDAKMNERTKTMENTSEGREIFARMGTYSIPQMEDDAKYGVQTDLQKSICQVQEQKRQHFKSKYVSRARREQLNLNPVKANPFAFTDEEISKYSPDEQKALKQGLDVLCLYKNLLQAQSANNSLLASTMTSSIHEITDEMKKTNEGSKLLNRINNFAFHRMNDDARYGKNTDVKSLMLLLKEHEKMQVNPRYMMVRKGYNQ